ncbi:MAG: xylosidase, partial [Bacteroidetes bacterium]
MNKILVILLICFMLFTPDLNAQNKHGKSTKYTSYKGLVMAGYQGWFRAPGDEANSGWGHFG